MGKTVIFGGTFNPIHSGHVEMLEALSSRSDVDSILVIPANIPPHKEVAKEFASGEARLRMCHIATEHLNKVTVSDMELLRGGKSYTVDTLRELSKVHDKLGIMIGADMLITFDEWVEYKEILKLAEIFAVRRPGIDDSEFYKAQKHFSQFGKITVIDVKTQDISSTELREILSTKTNVEKIPQKVYDYIIKKNLYS